MVFKSVSMPETSLHFSVQSGGKRRFAARGRNTYTASVTFRNGMDMLHPSTTSNPSAMPLTSSGSASSKSHDATFIGSFPLNSVPDEPEDDRSAMQDSSNPSSLSTQLRGTTPQAHETGRVQKSEGGDLYFMKLSYPENFRVREDELIHDAFDRARKYLGPLGLAEKVTEHLPVVFAKITLPATSTEIVRDLLGLPTEAARQAYGIVSQMLDPIVTLSPQEFWVAYWDLIQCRL